MKRVIASAASEKFLRFIFVNVVIIEQREQKCNGERSKPKIISENNVKYENFVTKTTFFHEMLGGTKGIVSSPTKKSPPK